MQLKHKRFMQCVEKMLLIIRLFKSCFLMFLTGDFLWSILHIWVVEVASGQIQDISWEQSALYPTGVSQRTQCIRINCWKSLAQACLYELLWCLGPTWVKWKNPLDYISTCNFVLKCHKKHEPWSATPETGLQVNKLLLCIWWNQKGVLYYEPLLEDQMINSNNWCSQSDHLNAALDEKHAELVNRMPDLPSG